MVVQYKDVHMRRKDFLIGGAQFEIPHRVVRNLYNNYENLGGHMPPVPPPTPMPMMDFIQRNNKAAEA